MPTTQIIEVLPQVGATQELIVNTLAQLSTTPRSNLTIAYAKDARGAGDRFIYHPEASGLTVDGGIVIPAQDGGYWVRDFDGRNYRSEWYGVVGDGVTDSRGLIQSIIDILPENTTLHLPDNCNIVNDVLINKSITVEGKRVIKSGGPPVFRLVGGFEDAQEITAFEVDFNSTTITVADGELYQKGDILKIISDDVYENRRTNSPRRGEYAVVVDVTATTVKLRDFLLNTYTTNPRVAKLQNISPKLRGIHFVRNSDGPFLELRATQGAVVEDISNDSGSTVFCQVVSAYGYRFSNWNINNLRSDINNDGFGYGINEKSGQNGQIQNCTFTNTRHSFTTNSHNPATKEEFTDYGESKDISVYNSDCRGTFNGSGWDTHENGHNINFYSCTASLCEHGFQFRNTVASAVGCKVTDCIDGYRISNHRDGVTDIFTNAANDIRIIACQADVQRQAVSVIGANTSLGTGGLQSKKIYIDGLKAKSRSVSNFMPFRFDNAEVEMNNVSVESGINTYGVVKLKDSDLKFTNIHAHSRRVGHENLIFELTRNSSVFGTGVDYVAEDPSDNVILARFIDAPGFNDNALEVYDGKITGNVPFTYMNGRAFATKARFQYRSTITNASSKNVTLALSGDTAIDSALLIDDNNLIRVSGTGKIVSIGPGRFIGQRLTIRFIARREIVNTVAAGFVLKSGWVNPGTIDLIYNPSGGDEIWQETGRHELAKEVPVLTDSYTVQDNTITGVLLADISENEILTLPDPSLSINRGFVLQILNRNENAFDWQTNINVEYQLTGNSTTIPKRFRGYFIVINNMYRAIGISPMPTQADSVATDVPALVSDFNALLTKLRNSGILHP
jgi:hypothetical protein